MSSTHFLLLLILSCSFFISPSFSATSSYSTQSKTNAKNTNFVKNACSSTTYPDLCRRTCLAYSSKIGCDAQKLANAALNAALKAAQSAAKAVTKLSHQKNLGKYDAGVIRDCIENMGDSIDDIKQSIDQINDLGSSNNNDMKFKISTIQTRMSAAITNENTCMDGMIEGKVSPCITTKIRKSIVKVAMLTTNALSLCNHLY